MIEHPENPSQNLIQEHTKRDPAIGASVRFATIPDSMGFSTFPGPAFPLP